MSLNPNQWTAIGGAAAVLGIAGGVMAWAWKYLVAFFSLFGHARRIKELAGRVEKLEQDMATKADLTKLGEDLRDRDDAHEQRDTESFRIMGVSLGSLRDQMAKQTDLDRIESKVDRLLLDGFNRGANRP